MDGCGKYLDKGKGMVPHVQLSTNGCLGCLLFADNFFITPTANTTVGCTSGIATFPLYNDFPGWMGGGKSCFKDFLQQSEMGFKLQNIEIYDVERRQVDKD